MSKVIDYVLVEKLASIMCDVEEIGKVLNVEVSTLLSDDKFKQVFDKGKETGKCSLRRMQFKSAENGNTAMLMFLSRKYLNDNKKSPLDKD